MRLLTSLALCLPVTAFAAGTDSTSTPPAQPACSDGMVRDAQTGKCMSANDARLDDGERYEAVREYAYADQIPQAQQVLDAMTNQSADGVLTYRGFTARKAGDMDAAMGWYQAALDVNPDNLPARSYMGQGLVESGEIELARAQLSEIRARGGRGTWAEVSLRLTLQSGRGYAY
ncbi:MAG: tetratricopeptide repeat protein [Paracoccaceae bacterium]|nr:tetratricopeptide repeat protein [Paracoccaceae bacterium]